MKVLILGSGGREHALAWKVAQADDVSKVYVAPGNAGTAFEDKVSNVSINSDAIEELIQFAQNESIDLTIVGPEAPLVKGLVDHFSAHGLRCFGPSAMAAQLEGSKAFSKDFLARHRIPTARYQVFSKIDEACSYISEQGAPIVVKADGLAAGKGVIVAETIEQAEKAVKEMLIDNRFGDAGARVVIEEFLQGEEASFICMVDGEHILPLASSQDHKARDNGDQGPNTGGMGAYSPAPVVDDEMHEQIMQAIIEPTVKCMAADGIPYVGFLYAGVMIGEDGIARTLEFNCRFGDPETQPIMMRLQSSLANLCNAALDGKLDRTVVNWDPRAALGVVMAAGGYPQNYSKGHVIEGLESSAENCKVFHAGTSTANGQIVSSGGRVLCVTALGDTVFEAQQTAYAACEGISWQDCFYRTDIGYRAVARERS